MATEKVKAKVTATVAVLFHPAERRQQAGAGYSDIKRHRKHKRFS
jgi:hypothetical protein